LLTLLSDLPHSGLFLKSHNLPKNFMFSEYLKNSMSAMVLKQLEVSPFAW
jgi:hypothetical protein